jgi:glycosyltransferase involved in cell wall biosynthesis
VGIRLVVVDDNPHVSWEGRVYPVNATFQHFVSRLLDLPGSPVASVTSCVSLRAASSPPATRPLDPRIRVVGTAPFDGIGGYLRHLPAMLRANRPILGRAIAEADLVWLKVPASNAPLAAALARAAGVTRFGYVAGSAAEVAAGQARSGIDEVGARLVGVGYDMAGRLASIGGDRVVVGRDLDGSGIVTSLVEPAEIRDRRDDPWPGTPGRLDLAWAGRLVDGKGLDELLAAIALLAGRAPGGSGPALDVRLTVIGAGPAQERLVDIAATIGIADRVEWAGYLADRPSYLAALAAADAFVFPSPAEGFPKVVLDAMAVGLPVVARPSGSLAQLGPGRLELIPAMDPAAIADAILRLTTTPDRAASLRAAGRAFAVAHTRRAEAARLVGRWQARWPDLPWR